MATIKSSGGDYTTIAAWENAIAANNAVGTCDESADLSGGSAISIDNAYTGHTLTASSSHAVNAPTYAALTGKARTTKTIEVYVNDVIVEKIGFDTGASKSFQVVGLWATGAKLRRCVVRSSFDGPVQISGGTSPTMLVSDVALILTGSGVGFQCSSSSTMTLYHCSAVAASSHWSLYYREGTMACYGCVAQGGSATVGQFRSTGMSGDYNVSQDTSAPGTTNWRSRTNLFKNTTAGSEDLSLNVPFRGWFAVDDYSGSADVATDIAGTSRAVPRDAGACQSTTAHGIAAKAVHYWPFDNNLVCALTGKTLTNSGTAFSTSPKKLGTHDLDAHNSAGHAYLADADFTAPTTHMSVFGWVYCDSTFAEGGSGMTSWVSKGTNADESWSIWFTSSSDLRFAVAKADGTYEAYGFNVAGLSTATWYFIVVSFEAGVPWCFVWSASALVVALKGTAFVATSLKNSAESFKVARCENDYGSGNSDLYLGGLGITDEVLTGDDMLDLWAAGSGDESWIPAGSSTVIPVFMAQYRQRWN